jgi:hypothetical protein
MGPFKVEMSHAQVTEVLAFKPNPPIQDEKWTLLSAESLSAGQWQTVTLVSWGDGRFGEEYPRVPSARFFRSAELPDISEVTRHPALGVNSAPGSRWRVETSRFIGAKWEPWTAYTNFTSPQESFVWVDREHSVSSRLLYRLRPAEETSGSN